MAKRKSKAIFLIMLVIVALAVFDIYYFLMSKPSYCYKDVCLIGEGDPIAEIRGLINSSSKAILVVEGDKDPTQKSTFISGSLIMLAKDFGNKQEQIIGIKMENGQAVECICTAFTGKNFTDCPSNSTSYCESLTPGDSEIMLKVYYPDFEKNEIVVDGRTVKFQAKSGSDAFGMVGFFEDMFIKV